MADINSNRIGQSTGLINDAALELEADSQSGDKQKVEKIVSELLRKVGALQTGHFLLSSGLHSNQYMQCQKVLQFPRWGEVLAQAIVKESLLKGIKPQAVVGPALGAVHWELLLAQAFDRLSEGAPVKAIFAERPDGVNFEIRRGVEITPGEKVLIAEDVITTGGSARKIVDLIHQLGGVPVGVAAIIDRSGGKVSYPVPLLALIQSPIESWQSDACPLCEQGLPLVKPGSTKNPGK